MSRYILIRRLRGPAILLLIGTLALLHQLGAIPYFWRLFWPLLLITLGLLLLAERAALASEGYPIFPGAPWQNAGQGPNSGRRAERAKFCRKRGYVDCARGPIQERQVQNDSEEGQS